MVYLLIDLILTDQTSRAKQDLPNDLTSVSNTWVYLGIPG